MTLQLEKNKTAVLSFGRHNPPTIGHEKLLNKVHSVAKEHGGTAHVVTSHSHDNDKNPVPQNKKLEYLRKVAHPNVKVSGSSTKHPTIMHAATKLHDAGHKHLVVVAGEDRVNKFHKMLNTYNGKKGDHGHYNFKSIKVVSSGKRDPDSHGTEGMSASKLRGHARAGDHDTFKAGLPKALHPHAKEIHGHVGGTQLESFKEALDRMRNKYDKKKKFKPSGEKTDVIMHVNPPSEGGDKRNTKPGSPSNTTRAGGIRFGEARGAIPNGAILSYQREDINAAFKSIDEATDIEDKDEVALKKIVKSLKKSVKGHDKQQKKISQLLKKDQQNEEKNCGCGQDPCITYGKDKEEVTEVLSRAARIKRALQMRRFKHKIQRKKKMMRKKLATPEMLKRRARRTAIKLVRKRFMGKKGEQYHQLGYGDKIMIDKRVAQKKAIINKIAQRLLPKVRRAELIRLKNFKQSKVGTGSGKGTKGYKIVGKSESFDPGFIGVQKMTGPTGEIYGLSKKDVNAVMEKVFKSDMDPDTLFEIFALGVVSEGKGTPQQRGFQSLNTFLADNYNTPAATEVPDKKYKPEEAITNLALNTRNRNSTIKNYNYGPMNDSDEEYWEKVADLWDTNTKVAKESRCHNCAAFDRKPATLKKIAKVLGPEGDKIVEQAHIGYCEMFAFKCAGQRVCDAWVGGGPITESAQLYEAMANWNDDPITGIQLDRRYNRPMVVKSAMPRLKEFKATGERSDIADPIDPKTVTHNIIKKDNIKKKKTKKDIDKEFESLSYPHETAKKYKKDTPGQSENFQDGKNPERKGLAKRSGVDTKASVSDLRKTAKNSSGEKRRMAHWLANMKSGKKKVQKEDAAELQRVMARQAGERDRIRQAHERDMEQMDNSEEKKRKREAHERRLQTLKQRQQAARDQARART